MIVLIPHKVTVNECPDYGWQAYYNEIQPTKILTLYCMTIFMSYNIAALACQLTEEDVVTAEGY